MSPEQARGDRPTRAPMSGRSARSLLDARRAPATQRRQRSGRTAVQRSRTEPLDRIRPRLCRALARSMTRALSKDPAERHQSTRRAVTDLDLIGSGPCTRVARKDAPDQLIAGDASPICSSKFFLKNFLLPSFSSDHVEDQMLRPAMASRGNPDSGLVSTERCERRRRQLILFRALRQSTGPKGTTTAPQTKGRAAPERTSSPPRLPDGNPVRVPAPGTRRHGPGDGDLRCRGRSRRLSCRLAEQQYQVQPRQGSPDHRLRTRSPAAGAEPRLQSTSNSSTRFVRGGRPGNR